ncbi:sentrin-specific protease 5 isoform X2 [Polypterus senegalus]|uniref:sentrin-specific protease 5 isoform X2 n=1 Tax=Polypterus senegalus TaxID=55291 RepID=UPI00196591C7|nr:sentrin-specific protease 5 isoform X2 [Polypterus senegalus]
MHRKNGQKCETSFKETLMKCVLRSRKWMKPNRFWSFWQYSLLQKCVFCKVRKQREKLPVAGSKCEGTKGKHHKQNAVTSCNSTSQKSKKKISSTVISEKLKNGRLVSEQSLISSRGGQLHQLGQHSPGARRQVLDKAVSGENCFIVVNCGKDNHSTKKQTSELKSVTKASKKEKYVTLACRSRLLKVHPTRKSKNSFFFKLMQCRRLSHLNLWTRSRAGKVPSQRQKNIDQPKPSFWAFGGQQKKVCHEELGSKHVIKKETSNKRLNNRTQKQKPNNAKRNGVKETNAEKNNMRRSSFSKSTLSKAVSHDSNSDCKLLEPQCNSTAPKRKKKTNCHTVSREREECSCSTSRKSKNTVCQEQNPKAKDDTMRNANEQVNLTIINGSCDADTDGSCGMDVDLSLQCSDPFQEQLQDHLYCKISSRFVTETIHTDDLRKGEKKVSRQLQSHEIGNEEMREIIHDFLEEFYGKYGSYIPLTENDVLEKLKQVLNTDVSDRKSFIFTEVMKYQATLAVVPMGNFKVTYNKHTLTLEDLSTLDGQNWLNDQVHFFNSFFYRQLATKGYEGVKRWTKKVDLFSKNLLLVPIHLQIHWSLITVDIPNQNIQLYDSQGIHIKFLLENIGKYILTEAKERNKPVFQKGWKTIQSKTIPQQKNDSDCGVFVLQYCKCLALGQPFQFSQEDMPKVRKRIYKELCECRLFD